jgi:subtilisin family serine protease
MAVSGAWESPVACTPGDPYLRWQQLDGWRGLLPDAGYDWVPLLLKRRVKSTWASLRGQLPELRLSADASESLRIATAWLPAAQLSKLEPLVEAMELALPSTRGRALPEAGAWPALPKLHKAPVVVGVIDRGGAPLHAAFRDPDHPERSRLLAFWDQAQQPQAPWQPSPAGYGRLLAGEALQRELVQGEDAERKAYARLGLEDLLAAAREERADHATHVMDTLAGLPDGRAPAAAAKPLLRDAAGEAPLVLVSVPTPPESQSGAAAAMAQVLDALYFIREVARRVAPEAAVVVNLSMGLQAGPRDGSLLLEQAIDELMRADEGLLVIMAAGNAAAQPQALGGFLEDEAELGWRIRPQDGTDSHLELSWERGLGAEPELQLVPPYGAQASPWVRVGEQACLRDGAGRLLGLVQLMPNGRGMVSLVPTVGQTERGTGVAGCWRVRLRADRPLGLAAQLQGDPWQASQRSSPQSYLEFARGLQLLTGGLPNALASGLAPLVVGAARLREGTMAPYTPSLDAQQMQFLAVADESAFAPGLVAAGALSGQWARMSGSSVATPVAARHWVNLIAREGLQAASRLWRSKGEPNGSGPSFRNASWARGGAPTARRPPPLRPGPLALDLPLGEGSA